MQASLFGDSDPSVKLPKPLPPKDVEPWSHLERLTKEQTYIAVSYTHLDVYKRQPYATVCDQ